MITNNTFDSLVGSAKPKENILILGSGPSALGVIDYIERFDNIIVLNGAVNLINLPTFSMFLDFECPKRDWFYVDNSSVRLVEEKISKHDRLDHYTWKYKNHRMADGPSTIPIKYDGHLYGSSSVATFALYAAYIMGYKTIYTCGTDFGIKEGKCYSYKPDKLEVNRTLGQVRKDLSSTQRACYDGKIRFPMRPYMGIGIVIMDQLRNRLLPYVDEITDLSDGNLSWTMPIDKYFRDRYSPEIGSIPFFEGND